MPHPGAKLWLWIAEVSTHGNFIKFERNDEHIYFQTTASTWNHDESYGIYHILYVPMISYAA